MNIIQRYVFGAFLSSFILAFLVLSFVLTVGLMVQIVGYVMDGVPASLVGEFALYCFPETLQWTMPLALLVASVLVFSRLSADSEIAAMRACGVNILSAMKGPLAFAVVCTLVGFYVNNEIVPRGHEIRRTLKNKVSVETGLDVLEPGRIIDEFPKVKIFFAAKEGNWLYDLNVWDHSTGVDRLITASKARVESRGRDIALDLYNLTVDPVDAEHPTMARAARLQYVVEDALSDSHYSKRTKDLRFAEALEKLDRLECSIRAADGSSRVKGTERYCLKGERSVVRTELSKRFVFALASICFVLVGIPLGIRAQRKESTVGMAISLAVSLGYYLCVILALSCDKRFALHPEVFIFLPPVVCIALAARLVTRNQ